MADLQWWWFEPIYGKSLVSVSIDCFCSSTRSTHLSWKSQWWRIHNACRPLVPGGAWWWPPAPALVESLVVSSLVSPPPPNPALVVSSTVWHSILFCPGLRKLLWYLDCYNQLRDTSPTNKKNFPNLTALVVSSTVWNAIPHFCLSP